MPVLIAHISLALDLVEDCQNAGVDFVVGSKIVTVRRDTSNGLFLAVVNGRCKHGTKSEILEQLVVLLT